MWPNPHETVDLVTFTEEILNGKLHCLCSDIWGMLNFIDISWLAIFEIFEIWTKYGKQELI